MRDELAVRLHQTTDARIWADEFIVTLWGQNVTDLEAMRDTFVTWFANAIETGRDHAVQVVNLDGLTALQVSCLSGTADWFRKANQNGELH